MKVLVIVVNYYCEPLVYSFVNGVLAQRFTGELRVLIVDNNSTPSRVVRLSDLASDDRVEVLSAGLNLGYFGAARFALKHYLGSHKPPDWTILSNPDITFPNLSFFSLLADLYSTTQPALVVPTIENDHYGATGGLMSNRPSRARMTFYKVVFSNIATAMAYYALSYLKRRLIGLVAVVSMRSRQHSGPEDPRVIYAPHGSFLIFGRRYFDAGGTLNHGAFLFGEEVFVAETARRLQVPIVYDPRLTVRHAGKATTSILRNRSIAQYVKESSAYLADDLFAES